MPKSANGELVRHSGDLDYYLCVFPADETAREMRGRLQHYVEERFPKGD